MWSRKAIVSTAQGASGINYTDGANILIAESASEFVDKIAMCFESQGLSERLGNNAHNLIMEQHNNKIAIKKLEGFYQMLLS